MAEVPTTQGPENARISGHDTANYGSDIRVATGTIAIDTVVAGTRDTDTRARDRHIHNTTGDFGATHSKV